MKEILKSRLTIRLRNKPITAVRFIRAVKYLFAEHLVVPRDVKKQQVIAIQRDILRPLLGTNERMEKAFSVDFIRSLLQLMAGLRVFELHPWMLSSTYIFAYFVISRREKNNTCMEAYESMLKGETLNVKVIRHVVNDIICNYGDLKSDDNGIRNAMTISGIRNFQKTLGRDNCKKELQVFAAWPEDLGLVRNDVECSSMENEMGNYFKLFEFHSSPTDELLNDSENDVEEISTNKRNLRSQSGTNNEFHQIELERIEKSTRMNEKVKGRVTMSKDYVSLKSTDLVNEKSEDNSKKVINVKDDTKDNEVSCSRIVPFVGKTLRKSACGGPEKPIEINCSFNTSGTNSDLINDTIQLETVTSPVISSESVIDSTVNNNNIPIIKKNTTNKLNFTAELVNKNIKCEPKSASQDTKENVDISPNDAGTKLASSKDLNNNTTGSSKRDIIVVDLDSDASILNLKPMNQLSQNPSPVKRLCHDSSCSSSTADTPISPTSTTCATSKRAFITVEDLDFEPAMVNSKTMNQLSEERPIVKSMCLDSRSNRHVMDSRTPAVTTKANFNASDNSGSALKSDVKVLSLDSKPCTLNSKTVNQQPHYPSPVKMMRYDSSSNSLATNILVPHATTNSNVIVEDKDSISVGSYLRKINPDFRNIGVTENSTYNKLISVVKNNPASTYTFIPGPPEILLTDNDIGINNLNSKTAATIDKSENSLSNCLSSKQRQSKRKQNILDNFSTKSIPFIWQSKKASMNEPQNVFNSQTKRKPAILSAQSSMTEIHNDNDNAFSSNVNNVTSPYNSTSSITSIGSRTIHLAEKLQTCSAFEENIFQLTPSTNVLSDQFSPNRADEECSNTSKVRPRILRKMKQSPLQQSNLQFNGRRYSNHCKDAQHYILAKDTSTLCHCSSSQQQQQPTKYVFNCSTTNSTASTMMHGANNILLSVSSDSPTPVGPDKIHYLCDYCPIQLLFESKEMFYKHMNDSHDYNCEFCQNRYPSR